MQHVVSQEWLFEHGTDDQVVIVDCRFILGNPEAGRKAYAADHIPGPFIWIWSRIYRGRKTYTAGGIRCRTRINWQLSSAKSGSTGTPSLSLTTIKEGRWHRGYGGCSPTWGMTG